MTQYIFTDENDWSTTCESDLPRDEFLAAVRGGDEDIWGDCEGCTVECSGDDVYYLCLPCDCGDEGCEQGSHENRTRLVRVLQTEWKGISGHRCGPNRYDEWPDEISYGRWHDCPNGPWLVPSYLCGSDYAGSLVERSNYEEWCELFEAGEDQWWTRAGGGHGTFSIVVDTTQAPYAAEKFLSALDDYPSASDERLSRLELEGEDQAWSSWARRDFIRALEQRLDCDFDEGALVATEADPNTGATYERDLARELFERVRERANIYWETEHQDRRVDVARVAASVEPEELADWGRLAA